MEDPTDSGALPGHPAWGAPAHWLFDRNGYRVLPPDYTILYDGAEHNRDAIPAHPRQGLWNEVGQDLWRGPTASGSAAIGEQAGEGNGE